MLISCLKRSARYAATRLTLPLLLFFWIVSGAALPVGAQTPVTAETDRSELTLSEQLTLRVTVSADNFNIPSPDLSGLTDFVVVSSSTSTQVSIINGQMTSQGVFSYRLQPLKSGDLLIPPISVVIDGQTYQTETFTIRVNPDGTNLPPSSSEGFPGLEAPETLAGQNLFVEAEVDNLTPYLGQQIVYTFRFYQAIDYPFNFRGRLDYQSPAFTDFWSQTVLSQPHYTTTAGERTYTVTEVRTALFPAGLNEITIEPARLVVPGGLLSPDVVLETAPVTIKVQSLPGGAPEDFNGAVGQFEIRAALDTTQGQVNDTLALVIEIEGAGNIEALTEPKLPEIQNWRFFDSQPSTTLEPREDQVYGIRRFERLIVPGQPGEYTIPSIRFSYYDPQAETYQTVSTEPIPVTILPDESGAPAEPSLAPEQSLAADIHTIKPVPASLARTGFPAVGRVIYWSCWILPLFIVGTVWLLQHQRQRLLTDTAYARRQRARRVAQKALVEARRPEVDSHAAVQRALLRYLSDKLNTPTTGLTTDNLIALLERHHLKAELRGRIRAVLQQVETSRFAPIAAEATASLLTETQKLLDDLEKFFGRRR